MLGLGVGEAEAAAALAHEVKNPLSLIRANVDLIRCELTDSESKRCVELIYREIDRINTVLTDYARQRDNREIVFLEDLLCDVIDEYHITGRGKSVEFVIESSGEDICVEGSYSKLCILFFNILKNAVEAVGEKGVIKTELSCDGELAKISVTDNGGGIDENIAAVVGKPFVSGKEGGMGLGIAICKKIAADYDGDVTLENVRDGGCKAVVRLKRKSV
jgi:signal transduction histidine kinase